MAHQEKNQLIINDSNAEATAKRYDKRETENKIAEISPSF